MTAGSDPFPFATTPTGPSPAPAPGPGSPFVFAGTSGEHRAELAITVRPGPQPTVEIAPTSIAGNPTIAHAHAQLASALQLWLSELVRAR